MFKSFYVASNDIKKQARCIITLMDDQRKRKKEYQLAQAMPLSAMLVVDFSNGTQLNTILVGIF
ncbi:MAG: hypothetical protein JKY90_07240 [Gammaproteobacteria bacterium]|nr:hypothetical protein [Gammaproteobacteria bacterium]